MKKLFFLLVSICLVVNFAFAQKIVKDKVRKTDEPFMLTIEGKDYKAYIKEYLLKHTYYKLWQKRSLDNYQKDKTKKEAVATIKILVSFNHDGKVWVSDHYSTPTEGDYVEDTELQNWVDAIAKELMQKIKKKGIVHPPYKKDGNMFYNDEVVVENVWRYKCKYNYFIGYA